MKKLIPMVLVFSVLLACQPDENTQVLNPNDAQAAAPSLPATPFNYANPNLPAYFNLGNLTAADNTPADNAISDAGATLGRVLFYEKQLSQNGKVSCGSCHQAANGFSDQATLSLGFEGGKTARHSMQLVNARYYASGKFFWDERAASLEEQVLMPIQDPVEMGISLEEAVRRLEALDYYPPLFTDAFGDPEITPERMAKAMAQFVRSMVSYQSKYDAGRGQVTQPMQDFPNYTAQENQGKRLFFSARVACAACHGTDALIADEPRNNGLDASTTDAGVGQHTGNAADDGLFKVGSLKNIALTAPYMHDGRFSTLREVIEHYNSGVQDHPNLSPPLRLPNNGGIRSPNLSETEKDALIAFLHTLTDTAMVNDEKFTDPFAEI